MQKIHINLAYSCHVFCRWCASNSTRHIQYLCTQKSYHSPRQIYLLVVNRLPRIYFSSYLLHFHLSNLFWGSGSEVDLPFFVSQSTWSEFLKFGGRKFVGGANVYIFIDLQKDLPPVRQIKQGLKYMNSQTKSKCSW